MKVSQLRKKVDVRRENLKLIIENLERLWKEKAFPITICLTLQADLFNWGKAWICPFTNHQGIWCQRA
ncbi:hypothetical protein T10_399 [Trichinella papuae]|uniref:Uncharacterized protein n=1 Tax=Trichinella papuae TaxID=268474 RepID=A0A0V1MG22_9BILA|nr:hypothetical protein T10_399 [Trichinella papuae]